MTAIESFLLTAYEFGLAAVLLIVGPFLLLKRKSRSGLLQKLGLIDANLINELASLDSPVWFHSVSVGEFNAAWPFIESFHNNFPTKQIVISTTTFTGQSLAKERAGNMATIIYFPFDLPWIVTKWLLLVRPSLVAILETELWPCFVDCCFKRNIPVVILNGRISPKTHQFHKLLKPLFAPLLGKLALISTQSEAEAQRYRSIGDEKLPIVVCGNLKYDGLSSSNAQQIKTLKDRLNIGDDELVLVAGSSHEGEESLVLETLDRFRQSHKNQPDLSLKLIIAPRHPERFNRVDDIIAESGYKTRRYSEGLGFTTNSDVLLLDTIGDLSKFYAIASVAFVGGTIATVGGHNLAEPYIYGVPVVCGPSLFKTKDVAIVLSDCDALLIGKTAREVEERLLYLLDNPSRRNSMGNNGKTWLSQNQGAVERTMNVVVPLITELKHEPIADIRLIPGYARASKQTNR